MVIDMNEAQVRTVEQVRQVLEGTQELQFRAAQDDEGRYGWIEAVLRRLGYRQLGRADKGAVLAYLQRLSGYSFSAMNAIRRICPPQFLWFIRLFPQLFHTRVAPATEAVVVVTQLVFLVIVLVVTLGQVEG